MRRILCIVTSPEDPFTDRVVSAQQTQPDCLVEVYKLVRSPDYEKLLDAIFAADSVQVW
jgi:hypothetical protein